MTRAEEKVIATAKALIQDNDGRTLLMIPGQRIDVDIILLAELSRAVVALRTERGESRFPQTVSEWHDSTCPPFPDPVHPYGREQMQAHSQSGDDAIGPEDFGGSDEESHFVSGTVKR